MAAAMRTWAALAEDALDLGEPEEPTSKVRLSSMLDGIWRLDGPSLASLVCDSTFYRVLMAGSSILDYGTATRTISADLFSALVGGSPLPLPRL